MQPVTFANGYMSEHKFNGIVVHLDTAIQKGLLKGFLVIQDIIDCPMGLTEPVVELVIRNTLIDTEGIDRNSFRLILCLVEEPKLFNFA